jgi:medium-chain acyl-[acyl-carrier-protein] hydrolase
VSDPAAPAGGLLQADSPFIRRAVRRAPACRLVCVPFAGAGASSYAEWPGLLPDEIELLAIQLPGREDRRLEAAPDRVGSLVRVVAQALRPYLGLPVAFFGQCAGSLLAFELAREVQRRFHEEPWHLFVSAMAAPHLPWPHPPVHRLPDREFAAALRQLGGTPPEIFANPALLGFLLPVLRSDFALWAGYEYREDGPLACPITALGGADDDRVAPDELEAWRWHTGGAFQLRTLEGGHFFVSERPAEAARVIAEALGARPEEA